MDDELRIGDAEREDAVRRLGEHYEAGRLSADEHSDRVDAALKAKTAGELRAVFDDLPGESAEAGPAGWVGTGGAGAPGGPGRGPGRGRGRRPEWAGSPFGKIPVPLLVALGVIGLIAATACTVVGGHPPVLLFAAVVAGVLFYRKRRTA